VQVSTTPIVVHAGDLLARNLADEITFLLAKRRRRCGGCLPAIAVIA
jgi:hypothetical protein